MEIFGEYKSVQMKTPMSYKVTTSPQYYLKTKKNKQTRTVVGHPRARKSRVGFGALTTRYRVPSKMNVGVRVRMRVRGRAMGWAWVCGRGKW